MNVKGKKVISLILMFLVCIFCVFPILWLLTTSLKNEIDAFSIPPKLIWSPTLKFYIKVFKNSFFMKAYTNSMIVAVGSTILALVLGIPASYALTRFNFKGRSLLAFWILITRMAPAPAMVIPFFIIMLKLKLIDTYLGLMLVYLTFTLGYVIWMMRGFFQSMPVEIEEAAVIDGCSRFQVFLKVVLPLTKPGIAAVSIFSFIFCWNEFLYALILTRMRVKTSTVAILGYITSDGVRWSELSAASILIIIPVLVLSMLVQRYIISGLTMGAIKE
jgi:multiple sugar transport system permease protein